MDGARKSSRILVTQPNDERSFSYSAHNACLPAVPLLLSLLLLLLPLIFPEFLFPIICA
jgi:hypothetical protein